MKRPTKIKILNLTYTLTDGPELLMNQQGAAGLCFFERNLILIYEGLPPDVERETVLHEILHVLNRAYQLDTGTATDEDIASRLGSGIMTVFGDNPKLRDWLFNI